MIDFHISCFNRSGHQKQTVPSAEETETVVLMTWSL